MKSGAIDLESARTGTPGGGKLRALRESRGRTQLWVEAEADLGTGYLQRVESGRVAQPGRTTIERILGALGARFSERRDIEEAFGYIVHAPLPDERDRLWARDVSQRDLDEVVFPAYALDCTARLVAWNRYLPLLLGRTPDSDLPPAMTRQSMLVSWFDPSTALGSLVAEPDALLPAMIRALRFELKQYRAESWMSSFIAELQAESPLFRSYWATVEAEPVPVGASRARVPLRLKMPGAEMLEFRLSSEPFTRDSRFRTIYYFPADPSTMRWCAEHASAKE
jgi:transcriptional regulator with XRE-family HTH domain